MPFTAPQLTQFFTSGVQMALTASQRASLAAQGLTSVDDFADFGKDELDQAIRNMRTHIPGVPVSLLFLAIMALLLLLPFLLFLQSCQL